MAIEHKITLHKQPSANTCGYGALATLLSYYGKSTEPIDLIKAVPQPLDEQGESLGSITAQIAAWCAREHYEVEFYTFDFQITDLSWIKLSQEELLDKLHQAKGHRNVPNLGSVQWSELYIDAYIDLIKSGARLVIQPYPKLSNIYEILDKYPLFVNVSPSVLYESGRLTYPNPDERIEVLDDINGTVGTHSICLYGYDSMGNFLVADPWEEYQVIEPDRLISAIMAASILCDSQYFYLK